MILVKEESVQKVSKLNLAVKALEQKVYEFEVKDQQNQLKMNQSQTEIQSLKQRLTSKTTDENLNPSNYEMFQGQQDMWSEELRRADERSSKFRAEVANLTTHNHKL